MTGNSDKYLQIWNTIQDLDKYLVCNHEYCYYV